MYHLKQIDDAYTLKRKAMRVDMGRPLILVTSAAGRTGSEVVQLLRAKGFPVRALVRTQDRRSTALEALGAEVVAGDLFDFHDIVGAMNGVARAFHCPPFAPNLLHNTMLFCLAAEQAKLEVAVLLSGWNPHPRHPSAISREHWIANNVARWMPSVGLVHVNPGIFTFAYMLTLPVTARLGVLPLPYGDGANAPVAERDIARVAAAILTDPEPHIGKSYRPTGPELLTPRQIAQKIGVALNRRITYMPVEFSMMAKAARAQGFPTFETLNLRHYAAEIRAGAFAIGAPTTHVEDVTGAPAEPFEATVRRYAQDYTLISPRLGALSTLGAIGLMMKIAMTPEPNFNAFEEQLAAPRLKASALAHECAPWVADAERGRLHLLPGQAQA